MCCWGFHHSSVWRCTAGRVVRDVEKVGVAVSFKSKQFQELKHSPNETALHPTKTGSSCCGLFRDIIHDTRLVRLNTSMDWPVGKTQVRTEYFQNSNSLSYHLTWLLSNVITEKSLTEITQHTDQWTTGQWHQPTLRACRQVTNPTMHHIAQSRSALHTTYTPLWGKSNWF